MGLFKGRGRPRKEPEPETRTNISEATVSEKEPPKELPELPKEVKEQTMNPELKALIGDLAAYGGLFNPEDFISKGSLADVCTLLLAQMGEMRRIAAIQEGYLAAIEDLLRKALND